MNANFGIILLAAIAGFGFGSVWYMALSKPWLAALGEAGARQTKSVNFSVAMGITFAAQLIMAWVLAGVFAHLLKGGVPATIGNGMLSAAFLWFGFVAPSMAANHTFQGARPMLTVIDAGHWLGVLLIQGAIVGGWGVR